NGELYVCGSDNGGATWSPRINVTNTPTPDCWPGECESDHWSSLAETVDDFLHITYMNDKDPGGIPQDEGVATENPVMYLAVDTADVWTAIGVEEEEVSLPATFGLKQNYPNPFNASTTIEYVTRTFGKVELAVYNLVGEKVEVLVDEVMPPGEHTVTWDADNVASGVYYYKLSTSEGAVAKRMLLLK
ncbi:MAG: T9SS type A sorting domain-containing protein, partial [Candidatus Zixiibacteriota bacterium]